jgi:DNA-binding NarL/FixJ family response regulator
MDTSVIGNDSIQSKQKIKIAIVDDHAAIRASIVNLLSISNEFDIIGSYDNAEEALILIPMISPELIIMDLNLGNGQSGVECIQALKKRYPHMLFVVYTVFEDEDKIFDALCAGANGYLLKKTSAPELIRALKEVVEGGAPMSALIANKVVSVFQVNESGEQAWNPIHTLKGAPLKILSRRENEILQQLASGLLYKEIALKLFISAETVRKHVYHIYNKLHVNNRTEAVNKYFRRSK